MEAARPGPRTSARACAGSRRSTWSTGTYRADGDGRRRRRKEPPISELDEAMEAVFEEDVVYVCDFEEGDKVVYPHHGAGLVLKKETRELMGTEREYLTIKILHNELTVMVPCENAGVAGLRRVIDEDGGHLLDFHLVDHPAKAGDTCVFASNHHCEPVVSVLYR